MADALPSKMACFTIGEATFLCQIGRDALRQYMDDGLCRSYKIGFRGHRMVTRVALISFMTSHNIPLDISTRGANRTARGVKPKDWSADAVPTTTM